jgi:hypothetical protein
MLRYELLARGIGRQEPEICYEQDDNGSNRTERGEGARP